ncbi:MAG: DUF3109 family protein [Saprospiraceae bacterium]|nr:DUF3109 family protein [Saprospiraceae bacterium]
MIAVQDKLVSEDIFEMQFSCNLEVCKGACCWEGDFGAPLLESELKELDKVRARITNFLPEESIQILAKNKGYEWNEDSQTYVTQLRSDGACVYMNTDQKGIAYCGIEAAFNQEVVKFNKPVSCHLYPIRVKENKELGFTAINYDKWKICNPACKKGKTLGIPVFKFVREGLVRRFGKKFFNELLVMYESWIKRN